MLKILTPVTNAVDWPDDDCNFLNGNLKFLDHSEPSMIADEFASFHVYRISHGDDVIITYSIN